MTEVTIDLTQVEDTVLDQSLRLLFDEHERASELGDTTTRAELHICIQQVVDEQARRTDQWIEHKRSVGNPA